VKFSRPLQAILGNDIRETEDVLRHVGYLDENELLEADFIEGHAMELADLSNFGADLSDQIGYLRERVVIPYMQRHSLT
jgi:hypothetical protein